MHWREEELLSLRAVRQSATVLPSASGVAEVQ